MAKIAHDVKFTFTRGRMRYPLSVARGVPLQAIEDGQGYTRYAVDPRHATLLEDLGAIFKHDSAIDYIYPPVEAVELATGDPMPRELLLNE